MSSGLRQRLHPKPRHDSDTAVLQADRQSRTESEVDDLKDELADKIESWREKVKQVGVCMLLRVLMSQRDVVGG